MRGRFAALTLLLLIAAGCQFQLAIKPIGSPKPNEVKAAAQKPVPAPGASVLSAKLDQRLRGGRRVRKSVRVAPRRGRRWPRERMSHCPGDRAEHRCCST